MILSDRDIKKALENKRIVIKPQPDFLTQLGSCSIDLRLGNTFRVFDHSRYPYIDPSKKDYSNEITKLINVQDGENFIMQPGDFVLAQSLILVGMANQFLSLVIWEEWRLSLLLECVSVQ